MDERFDCARRRECVNGVGVLEATGREVGMECADRGRALTSSSSGSCSDGDTGCDGPGWKPFVWKILGASSVLSLLNLDFTASSLMVFLWLHWDFSEDIRGIGDVGSCSATTMIGESL